MYSSIAAGFILIPDGQQRPGMLAQRLSHRGDQPILRVLQDIAKAVELVA